MDSEGRGSELAASLATNQVGPRSGAWENARTTDPSSSGFSLGNLQVFEAALVCHHPVGCRSEPGYKQNRFVFLPGYTPEYKLTSDYGRGGSF